MKVLLYFVLSLSVSSTALAKPKTYELDTAHSLVSFEVGHFGFSHIYGLFSDVTGSFIIDNKNPKNNQVTIKFPTKTANTNNKKRDKHLKNPDFLDVKRFPNAIFKSRSAVKMKGNIYKIQGDLTFHGVTRNLTLYAKKNKEGKGMRGEPRIGFDLAFSIKRSDYDMKFQIPNISDKVNLKVSLEATLKK